jgi:hypothetical protein
MPADEAERASLTRRKVGGTQSPLINLLAGKQSWSIQIRDIQDATSTAIKS